MIQMTGRPLTTSGSIFQWRSLKTKVTILTLAIFLIGIWSLALYASRMLRGDMQRVLSEQQFSTVSLMAMQINQELDLRLRSIEDIAARISPAMLGNVESLQVFLDNRSVLHAMFSGGLYVTRSDGTAIADYPISTGRIGMNVSDRTWMIEALKGRSTIGRPSIGPKLQVPVFSMAAPIRDKAGIVIGVLVGVVDLSKPNFLDKITDSRYGKTGGYVLIAPQHKLIVTGTDKSRIMQPLTPPGINPLLDRYVQGFEGSGIIVDSRGLEVLSSAKQVPVAGWVIVARIPTEEAFAPIRAMRGRVMLATIFLTLLAGVLIWWVLKRQLEPVFTTIKTLATRSDTSQPLPIARHDEIGELIGGFNRLLETLGQRERASGRLTNELAILADVGRLTGSTLEIDEVYERVVAEIGKLLPFDRLVINLYDEEQRMLDVAYVSGLDLPDRRVGDSFPVRDTIMEEVIRTRKGVIVRSEDPQGLVDQFPSLLVSVQSGMRSVMLVPLISRDSVIGNLLIRSDQSDAYMEQDLLLVEKIGMQISGAIANAQMFNELSKTEKALREQLHLSQQLLDAVPVPIFYKNDKGLYLGCNVAFQEFVGLTQEKVIGRSVHEIFPRDLADIYDEADRNLFRQSGTQVYETSFLHADGSRHDIIFNKAIYVGIDGRDAGLVGAIMDITELRHADQERRRLAERLQRSEKMEALGQLAGGVAHDLNNVLGILSGYSELLLDEIPEGSRSRDHVEKILQSTEKGAAIIQDLLTLARRGVVVSDVIDLNGIVSGFLKSPVFEKMKDYYPRVTFKIECDKNLPNIKGSPVHLEKTLMNLVSNAAESISGEGVVTLRTESRYLDRPVRGYDEIKEGDYAVLTVSDTGMGIPEENREKIFEPFYTKKSMGRSGTGLGLAIVWGTVKDHNGYINVQTKIGEGTTFTLYFPVTWEEMTVQQQKVPKERYRGKGESVLVVDDIAEQRDVASRLLTRLGYMVHAVSSGEEAVEYLKGNKVDILVLDMIMAPGIDGLETYRRVLEISPQQKAILVSGFSQTERVNEAQKLGAGAYVKKPYVMERIGSAIRDELDP
jgi:PAS domain S-box-containing protein